MLGDRLCWTMRTTVESFCEVFLPDDTLFDTHFYSLLLGWQCCIDFLEIFRRLLRVCGVCVGRSEGRMSTFLTKPNRQEEADVNTVRSPDVIRVPPEEIRLSSDNRCSLSHLWGVQRHAARVKGD